MAVEFRLFLVIPVDIAQSPSVDEDKVGVPRENFFLIHESVVFRLDFLGEISGPDPVQGEVTGIGAFDPLGSPKTDAADIDPGFLAFLISFRAFQKIPACPLDEGHHLFGSLFGLKNLSGQAKRIKNHIIKGGKTAVGKNDHGDVQFFLEGLRLGCFHVGDEN